MDKAWLAMISIAALLPMAAWCQGQEKLPPPEFYGLYAWAGSYVKYADDVEKTGIRWLRAGGWHSEAGEKGARDAEQAALLAAKRGVHLTPTLYLRELGHGKSLPLEEALAKWREMVRQSVEPYAPNGSLWKKNPDVKPLPIRHWQIWNEPNIEFLCPDKTGLTRVQLYVKLLAAAAEEIKKIDPGAQLIAFNTAGGAATGKPSPDVFVEQWGFPGWRRMIKEVNEAGGLQLYQAAGTHPYTMPKGPEEGQVAKGLELLRELPGMKDKPVWFTEVGYPLDYPRNQNVRDERQQACFMTRLYAIAGAHGVTQVQPMFIEDITYGPDNSKRTFGFFTAPGKWREQAKAVRVMIKLVPDPRQGAKVECEEENGVWAYRFKDAAGKEVLMAWNTGTGEVERAFTVKGKTLVTMLGEASALAPAGGKAILKLGEAPVYVVEMAPAEAGKLLTP